MRPVDPLSVAYSPCLGYDNHIKTIPYRFLKSKSPEEPDMHEINKSQFGQFLSARRKEKGYTQKELAQKLFLSDKAVSKWERGISLPDISLLIPLSDILDVTVTELLEGKRMETDSSLNTEQVENLVKKALAFSEKKPEKSPQQKRKHWLLFTGCCLLVLLESLACYFIQKHTGIRLFSESVLTMQLLELFFAGYFFLAAKEHLPAYFDENKISAYNDGFFEMNMPGIYFNNKNWPHILRTCRIWSVANAAVFPLFFFGLQWLFPAFWNAAELFLMLAVTLGGTFLPVYYVAKKYAE